MGGNTLESHRLERLCAGNCVIVSVRARVWVCFFFAAAELLRLFAGGLCHSPKKEGSGRELQIKLASLRCGSLTVLTVAGCVMLFE